MPSNYTGISNSFMKFNEGGGMEAMMRSMQGGGDPKKPKSPEFMLTGQFASPVMMDGDREYVMYDTGVPGQAPVKVYGVWNEYAVARDEEGNDLIADEDFPVRKNENGEFELDVAQYEATGTRYNESERMMKKKAGGYEEEEEGEEEGQGGMQQLLQKKWTPNYFQVHSPLSPIQKIRKLELLGYPY